MRREKFIYNPQTLRYEKVQPTLTIQVLRIFGLTCAVLVFAGIIALITQRFVPDPEKNALRRENDQLKADLENASSAISQMSDGLAYLRQKDAYAYRMIFGMDPVDQGIWEGGIGGHEEYVELKDYSSGELMASLRQRIRKVKHQYVLQAESLDEITEKAVNKEEMLRSMPSIKPVRSDQLARRVRLLSGFGYRIHPIFKRKKFHGGIDFTAPRGTPIYATGDGKVKRVQKQKSGYGWNVIIDHGYGYETLYAHMSAIDVKEGQKVTRGQEIGKVGDTGTSTAPHCHYEVHYKGEKVNPIHYVMDGLSPEEYQELVEAAEQVNQSFD